ncbi:MAG: hypothetical protein ACRCZE_00340 [Candidatus Altimarinota bacterium]
MIKSTNYTLKKWVFGAAAFIAVFTSEAAFIIGTSNFLSQGLLNWLPILLVLVSAGGIINFGLNLLLSKRLGVNRSLTVSFILLMLLIVVSFYMQGNPAIYLFLTLLVASLSGDVFDISITNLAGAYVNQRQAKSFLPFIHGVFDIAILAASAMLFLWSSASWEIDPLWLLIMGITLLILVMILINRLFNPVVQDRELQESQLNNASGSVKNSLNFVFKKSRLFYYLAWLFFFFGAMMVLVVYVYDQAFVENLAGDDLVRFIALINFISVTISIIFDFFFLKKWMYRLGVANSIMIFPWIMFLLSLVLSIWSNSLLIAAIFYLFYNFAYYSLVSVATQSMFGLAPHAVNQQAYFLIKGVTPSISALFASVLVTIGLHLTNNNILVVTMMLAVTMAVSLILALHVKKQYQKSLYEALDGGDALLKRNAVELTGERVQLENGEKMLRQIALDTQESVELRQKALLSLVEIGNPNSIREFLIIVEKDKNTRLRYYAIQAINLVLKKVGEKKLNNMSVTRFLVLDVFNKVYEENLPLPLKLEINEILKLFGFNVLVDFYQKHFIASSDSLKASIIEALSVSNDRGLITLLEPFLENSDLGIRAAAIASLWKFEEKRVVLTSQMIKIFSEKDHASRLASLKLISQLGIKEMDNYVLDLVAVPDEDVSIVAIITSIGLGKAGGINVLMRKLLNAITLGQPNVINCIFKRFYLLPPKMKKKFLTEIRSLSSANFDKLKDFFLNSDQYYDLELANLFSS